MYDMVKRLKLVGSSTLTEIDFESCERMIIIYAVLHTACHYFTFSYFFGKIRLLAYVCCEINGFNGTVYKTCNFGYYLKTLISY